MVSAIASRKYERAAISRLFRFTLAIQPISPLGVFPKGNLVFFCLTES